MDKKSDNDSPMTTRMVLEEDPNISEQAARAACVQPRCEVHCASRSQHVERKFCPAMRGLQEAHFFNMDFKENKWNCPPTRNHFQICSRHFLVNLTSQKDPIK